MSQVFINHNTEKKQIALDIKEYLSHHLISAWIDSEDIPAGEKLIISITSGIANSNYFIALISTGYISSNWCMHELEQAYTQQINGITKIIPILIDSREDLNTDTLPPGRARILESILQSSLYTKYDKYNPRESMKKIADAIGKYNMIAFDQIEVREIQGVKIQVLNFRITTDDGQLPTDIFKRWSINIGHDFLAHHERDKKPLYANKPVVISGKGPNWLYAYFAVQFKNLCSVYMFNNTSKDYICVYAISNDELGDVLKDS